MSISRILFASSALAALLIAPVQAADILLKFNESDGHTFFNNVTGSIGTYANFTSRNRSRATHDMHSSAGGGVSGRAGDRAFDNTLAGLGATQMGGTATAGWAQTGNISIDTQSFTLSGWFKTANAATQIDNGAVILQNHNTNLGNVPYLSLSGTGGALNLALNGKNVTSDAAYTAAGSWVFFAVTYDSTIAEDNLIFYVGSTSSDVSVVSTHTLDAGAFTAPTSPFILGSSRGYNNAFYGLLDNIYFHEGIFDAVDLEGVRVGAIPEAGTTAAFLGGVIVIASVLYRRRARA